MSRTLAQSPTNGHPKNTDHHNRADLDNLTEVVDRIQVIDTEKTHITHISAQISSNDEVTALRKEVEKLKLQIQEIGKKKL